MGKVTKTVQCKDLWGKKICFFYINLKIFSFSNRLQVFLNLNKVIFSALISLAFKNKKRGRVKGGGAIHMVERGQNQEQIRPDNVSLLPHPHPAPGIHYLWSYTFDYINGLPEKCKFAMRKRMPISEFNKNLQGSQPKRNLKTLASSPV